VPQQIHGPVEARGVPEKGGDVLEDDARLGKIDDVPDLVLQLFHVEFLPLPG
jgi:hypothetical protein